MLTLLPSLSIDSYLECMIGTICAVDIKTCTCCPPPLESGRRDHSKMFESSCIELTCSNILMTQLFILKGMLNRNSKLAKQHWGGTRDAAKPPKHHTYSIISNGWPYFWKHVGFNKADETCDVAILIPSPLGFIPLSR